jgi:hypothetical protein
MEEKKGSILRGQILEKVSEADITTNQHYIDVMNTGMDFFRTGKVISSFFNHRL